MLRNESALIGVPLFFISLVEIILGTLLLLHNPRKSRVHKSIAAFSFFTAAFSLITALMYVLASFGRDITFLARANWIGWLMIPAGLQFIYYMRDENSRPARIAGRVLYPFWIIVLCISISTNLIESGNYTLFPYLDRSGPLGKPLRIAGILQLLWVIFEIYRLRQDVSGIRRAQLNYFTNGLLIFTIGGTIVAGVFPLFGVGFEPGLGSYFSLPWVALTFYAMTRYRLFDIRSIISRLATVGLVSAIFAVVQIGLFKLLEPLLGASLTIAASLFLIGFLFFSTTFNQKVNKKIQDLVLQNKLDYQRVLKESSNAVITILDLHQLLNYLINSIKSGLGVSYVCLFLREKDGHYWHPPSIGECPEQSEERLADEPVIDWIKRHKDVVIREELEEKLSEEQFGRLNAWMRRGKTEVIIPLFYSGDLQGGHYARSKGQRRSLYAERHRSS